MQKSPNMNRNQQKSSKYVKKYKRICRNLQKYIKIC